MSAETKIHTGDSKNRSSRIPSVHSPTRYPDSTPPFPVIHLRTSTRGVDGDVNLVPLRGRVQSPTEPTVHTLLTIRNQAGASHPPGSAGSGEDAGGGREGATPPGGSGRSGGGKDGSPPDGRDPDIPDSSEDGEHERTPGIKPRSLSEFKLKIVPTIAEVRDGTTLLITDYGSYLGVATGVPEGAAEEAKTTAFGNDARYLTTTEVANGLIQITRREKKINAGTRAAIVMTQRGGIPFATIRYINPDEAIALRDAKSKNGRYLVDHADYTANKADMTEIIDRDTPVIVTINGMPALHIQKTHEFTEALGVTHIIVPQQIRTNDVDIPGGMAKHNSFAVYHNGEIVMRLEGTDPATINHAAATVFGTTQRVKLDDFAFHQPEIRAKLAQGDILITHGGNSKPVMVARSATERPEGTNFIERSSSEVADSVETEALAASGNKMIVIDQNTSTVQYILEGVTQDQVQQMHNMVGRGDGPDTSPEPPVPRDPDTGPAGPPQTDAGVPVPPEGPPPQGPTPESGDENSRFQEALIQADRIHDDEILSFIAIGTFPFDTEREGAPPAEVKFHIHAFAGNLNTYDLQVRIEIDGTMQPVGTMWVQPDGTVRQDGDLSRLFGTPEDPNVRPLGIVEERGTQEFSAAIAEELFIADAGLDRVNDATAIEALHRLQEGLEDAWPQLVVLPDESAGETAATVSTVTHFRTVIEELATDNAYVYSEWTDGEVTNSVTTAEENDLPVRVTVTNTSRFEETFGEERVIRADTEEITFTPNSPPTFSSFSIYDRSRVEGIQDEELRAALSQANDSVDNRGVQLVAGGHPDATQAQIEAGFEILGSRVVQIVAGEIVRAAINQDPGDEPPDATNPGPGPDTGGTGGTPRNPGPRPGPGAPEGQTTSAQQPSVQAKQSRPAAPDQASAPDQSHLPPPPDQPPANQEPERSGELQHAHQDHQDAVPPADGTPEHQPDDAPSAAPVVAAQAAPSLTPAPAHPAPAAPDETQPAGPEEHRADIPATHAAETAKPFDVYDLSGVDAPVSDATVRTANLPGPDQNPQPEPAPVTHPIPDEHHDPEPAATAPDLTPQDELTY